MKKFLSLFIVATLLLGMMLTTPVFAEGEQESYAKDTVIQATVIMPEADGFTGIEGKITYDKNTLEYCASSFAAPHVPAIVYNDTVAGKFTFNTSNVDKDYDISEDHIIITAQFKVLADDTVPDITSSIDDAYYVESGPTFVDVSKKSEVQITVVSTPQTEETTASEETQGTTATQDTQMTIETQATTESQATEETQDTTATQETQATEPSTAADEGYPVTFVTDGHATINVYRTRTYDTAIVDENVTAAVSRNRDTGEPDSVDENAQVNFLVVLENGYEVDSVTAEPATNYKSLKGSDETLVENMYRITKVAGELTITVTTKVAETQATTDTQITEETQVTTESQTTEETQVTESQETQDTTATQGTEDTQMTIETQPTEPAAARTIYYIDTLGWDNVYAYAYSDTYVEGDLPGTKMTYFDVDDDNHPIYSANIPADSKFIVFNNGEGTQTPTGTLTDDTETFYMKDGELNYYSHVTPTESQETQVTEPSTADQGYPVTFVTDGHATINVYRTRNYDTAIVDENVTNAVSRNRDTGEPDSVDENAQVNFLVVLENGYEIDSVTAEPTTYYKNLKGSDETLVENMYRITKVAGELTITVTTKLSDTQPTDTQETQAPSETQTPTETTPTTPTDTTPTTPTDTTPTVQPTETTPTQPTQAPATTIKVTAAKKTIYVGASTTVKATVTNPLGTTSFKSSNTKVATVTSAGKVVGKKAGSVTITATNNGKSASVKIKIVKRANPMTVKAKKFSLKKGYKTKTFTKAKAFTVKNAKGTVVFKKSKGNKKIAVSSKGKVTVKAGLSKGTYKVKVKVTAKGNTAYKPKTKKVTLKVVIS